MSYQPGARQQRKPEERSDGITVLSGHAVFNSANVSISLSIPQGNNESFAHTDGWNVSTKVGSGAWSAASTATVSGSTLTGTGQKGTPDLSYGIKVSRSGDAQQKVLSGAIAKAPANNGTTPGPSITVQ